jgi:hypothetical protein
MCLTGFSSRKSALSIYIKSGFDDRPELMQKLGRYKSGKSCLYIKRLSDIDLDVLDERIEDSIEIMKVRYGPD